jgi:hypothetical protein
MKISVTLPPLLFSFIMVFGGSAAATQSRCTTKKFDLFSRANTPIDYLDQTVCDNGQGVATSDDPGPAGAECPCGSGNARKINIGEKLPYHKYDRGDAQISDSFRLPDAEGRLRVLQTMFWAADSEDGDVFFNPNHGGYSVIAADGSYINIMGTYDQTGKLQPFYSIGCSLKDSWVLFPPQIGPDTIINQLYSWIASPACNFPAGAQPDIFSNAVTVWDKSPHEVTYTSGKSLESIVSYHYAFTTDKNGSNTLDKAVSAEIFYFTREYGMTRWESWQSKSNNPGGASVKPATTCEGATNATWGNGNSAVMIDCHDWSFVKAASGGGWEPARWPVDEIFKK